MRWSFVMGAFLLLVSLARDGAAQPDATSGEEDSPPADAPTDASPPDAPTDASPPDAPPPKPAPDPKLAQAKELFRQAEALRVAGACDQAIGLYAKSRELVSSVPNTLNAALCLVDEGRADEALALYGQLLATHRRDLTKAEMRDVQKEVRRLNKTVGRLDVAGDLGSVLVVAGRRRGVLPLGGPIPVLVGAQDVRLVKPGYEPHVSVVDIHAGRVTAVRARLKPLVESGRVVIDDPALVGADVVVDGSLIGTVPFDGLFAPGEHALQVVRGDMGTHISRMKVLVRQRVVIKPELFPLGPRTTITTTPHNAQLSISGVPVGAGRWRGRLPVGQARIEAHLSGYVPRTETLQVKLSELPQRVSLALVREPPVVEPMREATGQFWVDVTGGVVVSPGFNSGVEQSCGAAATCTDDPAAVGFGIGARVGYEFPIRLSLQLGGGFIGLGKDVSRSFDTEFRDTTGNDVAVRYDLLDQLRGRGGFVVAGLSYRLPLFPLLDLRTHLSAGAFMLQVRDVVDPSASTADGQTAAAGVVDRSDADLGVGLIILPEVDLNLRLDAFTVGLGLTVGIVPLSGPDAATGEFGVQGVCDPTASPTDIACAPRETLEAPSAAYGAMVMVHPVAHVGYRF